MSFILKNHIAIHYKWLDQKKDQNIVLINSLGTNFSIWDEVVAAISKEMNVLLFDKRGHGLSSTTEENLGIDDYADDVIFLMDELGIAKTHVLGLSIGGLITYSLASRYPQRFDKLIFSNTGAKLGTPESWDERIQKIEQNGLHAISDVIIERWFSPLYRASYPAETQGYINMLERTTLLGYVQACLAIREADYHPVLKEITHPSMFIGGSEDPGTTPGFVRTNAEDLNAQRIEIIDGAGHLPCIEAPAEMARLIMDFCKNETGQQSLYTRGMHIRRSVLGDAHVDQAEANKTDFDKDFQEYIVNSAWGSVWSRPHLSKRERSMITIALLAALGYEEELAMHLRATQNTGTTAEDVKEVLLHLGVYAGVPATNKAMKIAKTVYEEIKKS